MKSRKLLTIAVPTYQRSAALLNRIRELSPQLSEDTELRVFENGRTHEVADAILPYLHGNIHYCPSEANHGFLRNYLRCIEEGDSDWVWIAGDDDAFFSDAVSRACRAVSETSAEVVSYRTFSTTCESPVYADDLETFFRSISFSESLFITSTIWRRDTLKAGIETFLETGYTMHSHLLVILRLLEERKATVEIRDERLVQPCVTGHRWSRLEYMYRAPAVIDCLQATSAHVVGQQIWRNWLWSVEDSLKEVSTDKDFLRWRTGFTRGYRLLARFIDGRQFQYHQIRGGLSALLRRRSVRKFPYFISLLPLRVATRLVLLPER